METINLNLIPTGARPVLHASQYDKGRQFRANLFEGSAVYTLTGAETLSIAVRKPDGHIVTEGITNTSDSYIIIEATEQMTACAGDSFAEVKIEEGGDLLGTLNLILAVEQSPEEGGDPSDSFVYDLAQQIADAVADQYDSNNVIFDNTPTAGHGVGYAVTSAGLESYIPKNLDELDDVTTTAPTSGEALVWDGTKWVNGTVSTVGSLDDLNDVDTTGEADCDSLVYDSNSGNWIPHRLIVSLTQAEFDALELGGNLEPNTDYIITDSSSVDLNLGDLTDVDTTGASTGDLLALNGSTWEKLTPTWADKSDINDLFVVGTLDYTLTSAITVPANGYKEIGTMYPIIPNGAIFLDASVPNNNGGYLFFQIGYYGNYYIIARNFSGSAITLNVNQIISIRYMYKPNLT